MPDMRFSPTLNAAASTHSLLFHTLVTLEENASLEEKPTLMAELICTLLWILDDDFNQDVLLSLMLEVSTLTSQLLSATLKSIMITRSRMVMLSLEDSNDQQQMQALELRISTIKSSWHRLERSFSKLSVIWTQDFYSPASRHSRNMPTGTIVWIQTHIDTTQSMNSTLRSFLSSISGLRTTLDGMPQ
ncbi:hypothetical protein [Genomoviridae sp.]|nr:hypothetical protein [Genomoviridae sp.]